MPKHYHMAIGQTGFCRMLCEEQMIKVYVFGFEGWKLQVKVELAVFLSPS
jgi:hypothetical protein